MPIAELELLAPRSMNAAPQRSSRGAGLGRHKAKRALQADLAMLLLAAGVPRPIPGGRVRATATVYSPTRRRRDEGNYRTGLEKALGDALAPHDREAPFRWLDDDQPPAFTFGAVTFAWEPSRPARAVIRVVWGDELADEVQRELDELRGEIAASPCVYCGREAAPFDEHEACVDRALADALDEDPEPGEATR